VEGHCNNVYNVGWVCYKPTEAHWPTGDVGPGRDSEVRDLV
jgi:hypothetical protein